MNALDTCVMHTQAVILSEDDWNLVTNGRTLLNDEGEITPAAFEVMMLHQVLCGAVCCECVYICTRALTLSAMIRHPLCARICTAVCIVGVACACAAVGTFVATVCSAFYVSFA